MTSVQSYLWDQYSSTSRGITHIGFQRNWCGQTDLQRPLQSWCKSFTRGSNIPMCCSEIKLRNLQECELCGGWPWSQLLHATVVHWAKRCLKRAPFDSAMAFAFWFHLHWVFEHTLQWDEHHMKNEDHVKIMWKSYFKMLIIFQWPSRYPSDLGHFARSDSSAAGAALLAFHELEATKIHKTWERTWETNWIPMGSLMF